MRGGKLVLLRSVTSISIQKLCQINAKKLRTSRFRKKHGAHSHNRRVNLSLLPSDTWLWIIYKSLNFAQLIFTPWVLGVRRRWVAESASGHESPIVFVREPGVIVRIDLLIRIDQRTDVEAAVPRFAVVIDVPVDTGVCVCTYRLSPGISNREGKGDGEKGRGHRATYAGGPIRSQ